MEERLEQIEEKLEELYDKVGELVDTLEEKLDDLSSELEDAVECAVSDAVDDKMDDLKAASKTPSVSLMYVFTKDQRSILPICAIEARRWKNGEEPYAVWGYTTVDGRKLLGHYNTKDGALAEVKKLSEAVKNGVKYYEMNPDAE